MLGAVGIHQHILEVWRGAIGEDAPEADGEAGEGKPRYRGEGDRVAVARPHPAVIKELKIRTNASAASCDEGHGEVVVTAFGQDRPDRHRFYSAIAGVADEIPGLTPHLVK